MHIALIVIGAVVLLLLCLLLIPMPTQVLYEASPENQKKVFEVRVWGVKIYPRGKAQAEKSDAGSENKDSGQQQASAAASAEEENKGFEQFMLKTDQIKTVYASVQGDIKQILSFLRKKAGCREFSIHLTLGFDDAAATGIAAGAAYGLVYGAASLVHNTIGVKKLDVAVEPVFNQTCLNFYLKGIFTIAPVHIIKVLRIVLAMAKKIKMVTEQDKNK